MINSKLSCFSCNCFVGWALSLLFVLGCVSSFAQQKGGGSAPVDTFSLGDRYIAKKKYRKAARLYTAYNRKHPGDVNGFWKLAQVRLWMSNDQQSTEAYKQALRLDPKNDNLNLNYIHSLLDMGKLGEAGSRLSDMELAGKDYPNMALLRAKLSYYRGDFRKAAAFMKKDLGLEPGNAESLELDDMIEMARSPLVSYNIAYLADDQPLTAVISTLKAEAYFHRFATLYVIADEYHFTERRVSDAPWVRIGDKLFFPDAGIHMNIGGGIARFPVKDEIGWSANLALNKKISSQFDADLSVDHVPYLDTRTSIDTNVSATRFAAMLNWHARGWSAQAAFLNSTFGDDNNVYGAYAWALAPVARFKAGSFLAGYSVSYSNATESSYKPVLSLGEIVAGFPSNPGIAGMYNPYFTPSELFTNSVLLSLNFSPAKNISINLGGDIGYGTISNPYLFLDKDNAGNNIISRGFSMESFIPANATAAVSFRMARTWLLSARYTYHNSFFFTSNYASLGIQKSFRHRRKTTASAGDGFSKAIRDIEDRLRNLSAASASGLRSSAGAIRRQIKDLRDAQQRRRNESEMAPGSDEASRIEERIDNLDEMLSELDAVDLDEQPGKGKDLKQWLRDKIKALSAVAYPGTF